ncbi:MAG: type IIL restriction-modification enzyme MmeI, partial [Brachymonas sp.]
NGLEVERIHADLTPGQIGGSANLTLASPLKEAAATCFMGASKKAPFDIEGEIARDWLQKPNPHGKSNALVLRPLCNGIDLTRRWGDRWIVDFGTAMEEQDAMLFEAPYAYSMRAVKPLREKNNREAYRKFWWRHAEARPGMRAALDDLPRYIITAAVAKHRTFAWMHSAVLPDQATLATARADDTTFGILHSRFHEIWSLRMGTSLEDRPRYTPTPCFATFPFPAGITPQDTAHQRTESIEGGALIPAGLDSAISKQKVPLAGIEPAQSAMKNIVSSAPLRELAASIARAAQRLNALRENWLNPPEWTQRLPEVTPLGMDTSPYPERILPRNNLSEQDLKELSKRTLTNLYNQKAAGQVQWLQSAHEQLDQAVAAAYGWSDYSPAMPDEEILKRLLALNLERAAA